MTTWYQTSDPTSIKPVPWLSQDATDYLASILTPDMNVIEHGSGGSTLWFAERVAQVTAYEINDEWRKAVQAHAPENVTVTNKDFVMCLSGADLLLIDGEPVHERKHWLDIAPLIVKPGGWVVLDNANRPEYEIEREALHGKAELMFTSKLQGKHLVTEFYKLKG